ncbi:hypothetical protein RN001_003542 [Aquatica leii]|uniref:Uncharacterized protein n=1 Tax=Aquatica leii TaxID=1421715 RepID=A0AAN7PR78_9COLE|nr:hypothetical protein RN001_003542 [Aquatica leii]
MNFNLEVVHSFIYVKTVKIYVRVVDLYQQICGDELDCCTFSKGQHCGSCSKSLDMYIRWQRQAVRTTASPQCDWKIYSINILGAYDNYGKAQSKCNKAKDTDDLSSSASAGDGFGKGFRKPEKKRNKEYLYDEEEDDYLDDLPSLPHTLVNIDNTNTVHNVKLNQKKCRVNAESTNTSFALPASELQEFINDFRQWMVKSTDFYKQHTRELHLIKLIVKENRETLEFLMKSGTKQGNLHNPPEENDIIKLITPYYL